jgi:hypothetical protein
MDLSEPQERPVGLAQALGIKPRARRMPLR